MWKSASRWPSTRLSFYFPTITGNHSIPKWSPTEIHSPFHLPSSKEELNLTTILSNRDDSSNLLFRWGLGTHRWQVYELSPYWETWQLQRIIWETQCVSSQLYHHLENLICQNQKLQEKIASIFHLGIFIYKIQNVKQRQKSIQKELANFFSVKSQIANNCGFTGHTISVATIQAYNL